MSDEELQHRLTDLVDDHSPTDAPPFRDVLGARRRRRRNRLAIGASAAAIAVVAVGVPWSLAGGRGAAPSPAPATSSPDAPMTPDGSTPSRPEPSYTWSDSPSPVVLRLADRDVDLKPWTACWSGPPDADGIQASSCADGYAPDDALEDIGSPASVDLWFGRPGWRFDATFRELGAKCPYSFTVGASATGDQTFTVEPAGPADRYRVDLFGRGPEGDVSASFIWETPEDGPTEPARGTIALVSEDGSELTSYGLEVSLDDLADQPTTASVEVTATAANGRSTTLTAPWRKDGHRCYDRGSVFFDDDDAAGVEDLGPAPYTYEVVVTLDGVDYVGRAVWPRDEIKSEAPYTRLMFDPPLPGYGE